MSEVAKIKQEIIKSLWIRADNGYWSKEKSARFIKKFMKKLEKQANPKHLPNESQRVAFFKAVLFILGENLKGFGTIHGWKKASYLSRYLIGYEREDGIFKPFENGLLLGQTHEGGDIHPAIARWVISNHNDQMDSNHWLNIKREISSFAKAWKLIYHVAQKDKERVWDLHVFLSNYQNTDYLTLKQIFDKFGDFQILKIWSHWRFDCSAKILLDKRFDGEKQSQFRDSFDKYLQYLNLIGENPLYSKESNISQFMDKFADIYFDKPVWKEMEEQMLGLLLFSHFINHFNYPTKSQMELFDYSPSKELYQLLLVIKGKPREKLLDWLNSLGDDFYYCFHPVFEKYSKDKPSILEALTVKQLLDLREIPQLAKILSKYDANIQKLCQMWNKESQS